jgi:hypothetical protein
MEFNQATDRPMVDMNVPQDELNHIQPRRKSADMSKEQVEIEISKYDRQQEDKEEEQSDVFKQYCWAPSYDERVAIQQGYIQRHTPYGERVKTRDILMMKQLPRLKLQLYP